MAVDLLLSNGAAPDTDTTAAIKWEDHDIILAGTPLDWAVLTRNKQLFHSLAPYSQGQNCLRIAIGHFFWDIQEELLKKSRSQDHTQKESVYIYTIKNPFSHWIAHGLDRITSIEKTVKICQNLHITDEDDHSTPLMTIVSASRVDDDFRLIEAMAAVSSDSVVKQTNNDGFSALLYAISMANCNNSWLKTLQTLTKRYTVDELQQKITFCSGSFLHLAVSMNSVVGARVLLQNGVEINHPTYDEHKSTPLHICMMISGSIQMFALLVEYGAALQIRDKVTGDTPLQARFAGIQVSPGLADMALQHMHEESIYSETIHQMLSLTMGLKRSHRSDAREAFRHLLASQSTAKYINCVDKSGATLVQRAAYHLHLDSLLLLLESNADASIPFHVGDSQILPLQIACSVGRLYWMNHTVDSLHRREKREISLAVATELLQWHDARGDQLFRGISVLHLASHMAISAEVQKLLSEGKYNPDAKGCWPSLNHNVTPRELGEAELAEDIAALETFEPQFVKDMENSDAPIRGQRGQ